MTTSLVMPGNHTYADEDVTTGVSEELLVQKVMRDRGVGKKAAYVWLRKQSREAALAEPTPIKQRDQVLLALLKFGARDGLALMADLHSMGIGLDLHDTQKTLWSLLDTGHVRFRERQGPKGTLYAIKLTNIGEVAARRVAASLNGEAIIEAPLPEPEPEPTPEPVPSASLLAGTPDLTVTRPLIDALRARWAKSERLAAVAKSLEELGEDDMALTLMGRTEFTPFEREVIDLLREIE